MKLCTRWPRCDCVCRGFLNKDKPNSCGIRPRLAKDNKERVDDRDVVDQIFEAMT